MADFRGEGREAETRGQGLGSGAGLGTRGGVFFRAGDGSGSGMVGMGTRRRVDYFGGGGGEG